ncbi:MAG: hypothetical protein JWQ57_623 [Mucilaginibacter sp.]|nr:hypothetical protein [Mucilaginibacter sp.]
MKKTIKNILLIGAILAVIVLLFDVFFFRTYQPEISSFKESRFDFLSSKPIFFQVDKKLYYAADGRVSYNLKSIWDGRVEQTYVSPNGKYALVYQSNKLTLIDAAGNRLFEIKDCTDLIATEGDRKSGRFISAPVQWGQNSDFFLIAQDRVWDKNYSKKNKSSIYKYRLSDKSFGPLINLNEEVVDDYALSTDEKYLYYEFATDSGSLALKKMDLSNGKKLAEYLPDDQSKLRVTNADSIYFNYDNDTFVQNSYDLHGLITPADYNDSTELYYRDTVKATSLLSGISGYNAFKGNHFSFYNYGYFLPGNRFFIAYISAQSFKGQLVIDTKTFRVMKLPKPVIFFFNINTKDCGDFIFRGQLEPNVNAPGLAELGLDGRK